PRARPPARRRHPARRRPARRRLTAWARWPGPAALGRTALDRVVAMEYRSLGKSGLRVSVLTMGTMTFGGRGSFANVGSTDVAQASRQVDICLDAGVNLIDTADVYSGGLAEEILGQVLPGRRDQVLVATKV